MWRKRSKSYPESELQMYVEDPVLITEVGKEVLNHYSHEPEVIG